uniref:Sesquipedalian n=1 Tax=Takifugu rubripes TaxID=31033 RepID=A0A674MFL9_TAKRU
MRLNERSVAHYATCDTPPDKTGFLFKKGERNPAYHRRWFVLKANMLFYFEERDSREPVGVIVLEGCTVELCESAEEFAFAIKFDCAKARVYKMAAESQAAMESWVKALSRASFDYMRLVVKELERQLEEIQEATTGSGAAVGGQHGRPRSTRRNQGQTSEGSKENKATRNKSAAALTNGFPEAASSCVVWEGCVDPAVAPPVPPRRRGASLESSVSPGTGCFSKLHDWYGKEVEELRVQWLQSQ